MSRARLPTLGNQLDQLLKGEDFRADGIRNLMALLPPQVHGKFREIDHINRLQRVVSRPRNGERRQMAQDPGDVVDQHVFHAKNDGGPQNRVRSAATRL